MLLSLNKLVSGLGYYTISLSTKRPITVELKTSIRP